MIKSNFLSHGRKEMNLYFLSLVEECKEGRRESIRKNELSNGKRNYASMDGSLITKNGLICFVFYRVFPFSKRIDIVIGRKKYELGFRTYSNPSFKRLFISHKSNPECTSHEIDSFLLMPIIPGANLMKRWIVIYQCSD
jgi:hypothetical protein